MNKAFFVLPFILLSLLLAIWGGWLRVGWSMPVTNTASQHGAIMVGSFLSTLIFLERAVTFKSRWMFLLPAVNGLSAVFFLGGQYHIAQWLLVVGSAGFVCMCAWFIYQYKELYYYVFFCGAACLLVGNILLLKTKFYPNAVNWWMVFLLFTIIAERLELSRFLSLTSFKRNILLVSIGITFAALLLPFHLHGNIVFSIGLASTAIWLLRYDMAKHSLSIRGQHRYSAQLLITGYVWLLFTAALLIIAERLPFAYDAVLHSFFIGFVFSMIFSHAPIILPAVLKLPLKLYKPVLYYWFVLLQVSLAFRIGGDILANMQLRKWGGLLNGVAILCFFISVISIVQAELHKRRLHPA
jgi:hypothetical protein